MEIKDFNAPYDPQTREPELKGQKFNPPIKKEWQQVSYQDLHDTQVTTYAMKVNTGSLYWVQTKRSNSQGHWYYNDQVVFVPSAL